MEIKTKVRRWGNSFGVIVPIEIIQKSRIEEGDEIIVNIEKNTGLRNIFGSLKLKKSAQEIKDEIRREER